jgi:hypothetical protein
MRPRAMLLPTKQMAWAAFSVIDNVASDVPEFETDPFHRSMVRWARAMLRVLEPALVAEPKLATTWD